MASTPFHKVSLSSFHTGKTLYVSRGYTYDVSINQASLDLHSTLFH